MRTTSFNHRRVVKVAEAQKSLSFFDDKPKVVLLQSIRRSFVRRCTQSELLVQSGQQVGLLFENCPLTVDS